MLSRPQNQEGAQIPVDTQALLRTRTKLRQKESNEKKHNAKDSSAKKKREKGKNSATHNCIGSKKCSQIPGGLGPTKWKTVVCWP